MRRRICMVLLCLLVMSPLLAYAQAEEFCFDVIPFSDKVVLRLLPLGDGETFMGLLAVQWRSPIYQLGGAGAVLESHPEVGSYVVNLAMRNNTAFFEGNGVCTVGVTLTSGTLIGPWHLTCVGATPPPPPAVIPPPFQVSGTLVPTDCASPVLALRQGAPERTAAGEAFNNENRQP